MRRLSNTPRKNWLPEIREQGLVFHTDEMPYWREDRHYAFSETEAKEIIRATNNLHSMCLEAVDWVIKKNLYHELGLPIWAGSWIKKSWQKEQPSIIGRFDLRYDGINPPVMLEYNADTPTSLLEGGLVQRSWQVEVAPRLLQCNWIEERLVETWSYVSKRENKWHLHLACLPDLEDMANISYLGATARGAGLQVTVGGLDEISYIDGYFRTPSGRGLSMIFKLYPWEWFFEDPAIGNVHLDRELWLEPVWKVVLSSKGILPILWEMFPGHPNLLPAWTDKPKVSEYVIKPKWSREGQNVTVVRQGQIEAVKGGVYGQEGCIWQGLAALPKFDDWHPVIGSWVIGGQAAGFGIRESWGLITDNRSFFVPHVVVPDGEVWPK